MFTIKFILLFLSIFFVFPFAFPDFFVMSISTLTVLFLQVTTTIGFGSPNKANSYSVHGSALGAKEVEATRNNLGWPYEPFHLPEDVKRLL